MTAPKLQPALLGGLTIGVLSALPIFNWCCCGWMLLGGTLAAYVMQQNYAGRITLGDGVVVGLLAGLIGAGIWAVVSLPIALVMGPFEARMMQRLFEEGRNMPPDARAFLDGMQGGVWAGVAWFVRFILMLCFSAILGLVGGLFGALLFAKDVPPPPPPPAGPPFVPPSFTPPPLPGSSPASQANG